MDPSLHVLELRWERIQWIIRAARDDRDETAAQAFRLERTDGPATAMVPTRAWLDGDELFLRFNVMQGPGQDPLRPGRWVLTTAGSERHGRGTPVAIRADTPDLPAPSVAFDLPFAVYHATPRLDAATHGLSLLVALETAPDGRTWRQRLVRGRARLGAAVRGLRGDVFRVSFGIARRFVRRNGRRILFTSDSHAELSGNLKIVYERMTERGLDRDHDLLTLFKPSLTHRRRLRDRVRLPWLLARADVIVIDDFQPIISWVDVDPAVRMVQLWHASGAFKTVGYSRIGKEGGPSPWSRVHKNYTHAIVSSELDVPSYAEAFGIAEAGVIPTGIPRMDRYFDAAQSAAGRAAAHEAFPATQDRFTILFAPTFRGNGQRDANYDLGWIDVAALHAVAVARDAVVIIKMHPFVRESVVIPEAFRDRIIDASRAAIDVNDLLFAVDLLITDYSSIVFEFSTLGRPMLFYAPDLDEYIASRDFYTPFEAFVPGRIVRTFDALVDAIRTEAYDAEKVAAFAARHFSHLDGSSTDRVIDEIILAR